MKGDILKGEYARGIWRCKMKKRGKSILRYRMQSLTISPKGGRPPCLGVARTRHGNQNTVPCGLGNSIRMGTYPSSALSQRKSKKNHLSLALCRHYKKFLRFPIFSPWVLMFAPRTKQPYLAHSNIATLLGNLLGT